MADEPRSATDPTQGGDTATAVTGTAAGQDVDAGRATETVEQENARLKAALEQAKAEKSGREEERRKLAEAEARLAQLEERGLPPTTAPQAGPFEQLSAEIGQYEQYLTANPNDMAAARLLRQARSDYANLQWQALYQRESPKLQKADDRYRAKAIELFGTGRYLTAEDAILAARGAVLTDDEIARQRREDADKAAATAAAGKPATDTASGTEPPGSTRSRPMTGSEFTAFMAKNEGKAAAHKLSADVDGGTVAVDWSR